MAEKLGVGIIGAGAVSRVHARAWQEFPQRCELIAICDPAPLRLHRFTQDFDVQDTYNCDDELLSDSRINVVSICTPNNLHAAIAKAALQAGKHVLVEKPMAMTVHDATEMIDAAKAHNTKLTVVFQRRVDATLRFIKERVVPEIGEIQFSYLIDSHFRGEAYYERSNWRGTSRSGGVFANQAIHTWDIFQWYQEGVKSAYGYWTNLLHPAYPEIEDIGYGLVEFKCGAYGKLFTTSCCHLPEGVGGMRIIGTKGEITGADFSLHNQLLEERLKKEMAFVVENTKYTGHTAQVRDLIHAIDEDREPEVSADSAKESLKILEGIYQHGTAHTEAFRQWAFDNFEMPKPSDGNKPTAEDTENEDWRGGGLIEHLADIVKKREKELDVPF